jgi:predicted helicase
MTITPEQEKAFKNVCDDLIGLMETDKGRDIVSRTADSLRNGIIDKFHLITDENTKEMLVLHIATLPVFQALFGEKAFYNPITMILNAAANEILEVEEGK